MPRTNTAVKCTHQVKRQAERNKHLSKRQTLAIDNGDWSAFLSAPGEIQYVEILLAYIDQQSDDAITEIAFKRNNGVTVLTQVAQAPYYNRVFDRLLSRIPVKKCNEFALSIDIRYGRVGFIRFEKQQLLTLLNRLSPEILNRVALLHDDNDVTANGFMYAANRLGQQFIPFITKLSPATLNQLALQTNQVTCSCGLRDLYFNLISHEVFLAFFNSLPQETIDEAAMLKNKHQNRYGRSLFFNICLERGNYLQRYIINHISPEILAQALLTDKEFTQVMSEGPEWSDVGSEALSIILSRIFQSPAAIQAVTSHHPQLHSIAFYDRGKSEDIWSMIAKVSILRSPQPKKQNEFRSLSAALSQGNHERHVWASDFLNNTKKHGITFWRLQGRTILLRDKNNQIIAIKVQKDNENREALIREYDTTRYLKEHAAELNLQSTLPEALSVTPISGLFGWLNNVASPDELRRLEFTVTPQHFNNVYIYRTDATKEDYFTYLHDPQLSEESFAKANRVAVHDLFTLLANGVIFPQLADIFHNSEHVHDREDKGRYRVFVNLLNDWNNGSGRITAWKEAVAYPNLRASGLADLGDRATLNDFIGKSKHTQKLYPDVIEDHGKKHRNSILANLIGEYQYILFLIAGRRGSALTDNINMQAISDADKNASIQAIWNSIAQQVLANCAQAVSIITHQNEKDVLIQLSALVEVDRLARQMRYFMTTEYVNDLANNHIPSDIYGNGVNVSIDITQFRLKTFNNVIGCSLDGIHQDLGPVNGQEPIKEANKLFYWTAILIFEAANLFRYTIKNIREIASTTNLELSEKQRATMFLHLPSQQQHRLQASLCEERLKQKKPLPADIKKKIEDELIQHRRELAAGTICRFWRSHAARPRQQTMPAATAMEIDQQSPSMNR